MSGTTKKAKNRPDTLFFTPFKYKLHWTTAKGSSSHGETSLDKKEIILNEGSTKEAAQETLVHEALHVLCEDLIPVVINYEGKEEDAEETFIRLLSPRLYSFLKLNPAFVNYILKAK